MKRFILTLLLCLFYNSNFAQKAYSVNGESFQLKTEISGTIDLLWNIIDGEYRYFIKKGDVITELTNVKDANNKYQENYKTILESLTTEVQLSFKKVKLTLPSLRDIIYDYNSSVDSSYSESNKKASLQANLLVFGGITNQPFIVNNTNTLNPVFGVEIEIFESNNLPKHSLYFQAKHALSSENFNYSNTQLGIGYRFRLINLDSFNFYANIIAVTYTFNTTEVVILDQIVEENSSAFDAPFIFGIGADIKISNHNYITLSFDELFAISLENQGNFSTHITIGYKRRL